MKLASPPPQFMRASERAATALLRAEAAALPKLRRPVRAATGRLLARLSVVRLDDRRAAAELLSAGVRVETETLTRDASTAIQDVRLEAKRSSTKRLGVEWEIARRILAKAGSDTSPLPSAAALTPRDIASADASARSLAAQWSIAMTSAVWEWRAGRAADPGAAITRAGQAVDPRIRRTATTETARAFADARDEGMGWIVEEHKEQAWIPMLVKRWDAMNDSKVCRICAELDGTVVLAGTSFPGGAEPGYVHPSDRCVPTLVLLPMPLARMQRSGRYVPEAA